MMVSVTYKVIENPCLPVKNKVLHNVFLRDSVFNLQAFHLVFLHKILFVLFGTDKHNLGKAAVAPVLKSRYLLPCTD